MADIDLPEALARELATVGAREHWLSLSHGATRYLEAGNGPTLVALHGFAGPSGADRYLHMMPYWTSRFRVIAVDMLNWGPGARPKHEYSSPLHIVDALRELLDAIEVDRCFIVGHCYGGRVAL